ncbi:MAG: hypothetical protein U0414_30860 [Polyangiaceae bacterium]
MRSFLREVCAGATLASFAALPAIARADGLAKIPGEVVTTGAGPALAAHVDGDHIVARACAKAQGCSSEAGTAFHPSQSVQPLLASAKLRVVKTSKGKQLIELRADSPDGQAWILLLAPGEKDAVRIAWKGWTSANGSFEYVTAKDGQGESVRVVNRAKVCGRQVVLSEMELDPDTLVLVEKALGDPVAGMRAGAAVATVTPGATRSTFSILRGTAASGEKSQLLLDGDASTAWSPSAPNGVGVAAFSGPADVGVTGLQVVLGGSSAIPKSLFLVTNDGAFTVTPPADTKPGSSMDIVLAKEARPLTCLAIVVDPEPPAKGEKPAKGAKPTEPVAIAEVKATTRFDDQTTERIAGKIDPRTAEGKEALALLRALGPTGMDAAIAGYGALDGPGREAVRNAVEEQKCGTQLALYVPLLASEDEQEADRANDHVLRCGSEAVPVLVAKVASEKGKARATFADELGLLPPEDAIPALIQGLGASEASEDRSVFRRGLSRASKRQKSVATFDAALTGDAFGALPLFAQIDLLRSVGDRIGDTTHGAEAFQSVWTKSDAFRTRYLLLPSAAALARKGDAFAIASVNQSLEAADDPHLRARAAELSGGDEVFANPTRAALTDAEPRVREAALRALPASRVDARQALLLAASLQTEPWTFVKRATIATLAKVPANAEVDAKLVEAMLYEEQPAVRGDILDALGERGAVGQREAILERALDAGEATVVRISAIRALGALCDTASLEALTKLALIGLGPGTESDAKVAIVAIAAIGAIHPQDIEARIGELAKDGVIADVHSAAVQALKGSSSCKR